MKAPDDVTGQGVMFYQCDKNLMLRSCQTDISGSQKSYMSFIALVPMLLMINIGSKSARLSCYFSVNIPLFFFATIVSLFGAGAALFLTAPAPAPAPSKPFRRLRLRLRLRPKCVGSGGSDSGSGSGSASLLETHASPLLNFAV